jgi:glycosyltransferase involved in cell wall biosynthesis
MPHPPDVAIVSLGTTAGLRHADEALAELLTAAGASCQLVRVQFSRPGALRRGMLATDVAEAYAARRAAAGVQARAVVYSSVTAALLQRATLPYAVRFDSLAAQNRPGPGGLWQRRSERTLLRSARLLLPWSAPGARWARSLLGDPPRLVGLPPPVDGEVAEGPRDLDAVAYAANPAKRGLELLSRAWQEAAPPGARLTVGGIDRPTAARYLRRRGLTEPAGIEWAGLLPRESWLALVGRARIFVNASRYEDWGLAQMEALAAGTPVVTVPSAGSSEALPLARRLAPGLVAGGLDGSALAAALRAGLELDPRARAAYGREAARLLAPYRRPALGRVVAEEVLPKLLGS